MKPARSITPALGRQAPVAIHRMSSSVRPSGRVVDVHGYDVFLASATPRSLTLPPEVCKCQASSNSPTLPVPTASHRHNMPGMSLMKRKVTGRRKGLRSDELDAEANAVGQQRFGNASCTAPCATRNFRRNRASPKMRRHTRWRYATRTKFLRHLCQRRQTLPTLPGQLPRSSALPVDRQAPVARPCNSWRAKRLRSQSMPCSHRPVAPPR